tara:strand:+ start:247 stop:492 length:246 start_codon:yes stop_codon:yes gene_type:complete
MTKTNKGTEHLQPFDGEDVPRETKKTLSKRVEYVQAGLKKDALTPKRSLNEFGELVALIGSQFDDMNTFTVESEIIPCQIK